MNFQTMGSVSSYIKNLSLNVKFEQRKQNNFLSQEENTMLSELRRQAETANKGRKMAGIQSKLMSGSKLSLEELEYLRVNDPESYNKAMRAESERKAYEKALSRCKSKEEVEQLKTQKLGQFMSEAKAIMNNPNIPEEKKLEQMNFLAMRMGGVMEAHRKFTESAEYARLPERREDEEEQKTKKADKDAEMEQLLALLNEKPPAEALEEMLGETGAPGPELPGTGDENAEAEPAPGPAYDASGAAVSTPAEGRSMDLVDTQAPVMAPASAPAPAASAEGFSAKA